MPEKLEEWFVNNPFAGVMMMALLGGLVAHIKSLAKMLPEDMTGQEYLRFMVRCTAGFFGRIISAALGGLMVMFFWRATEWRWEYGFVAAGVVGLFSTEFFDWLWAVGRAYIQKRVGLNGADIAAVPVPTDREKG